MCIGFLTAFPMTLALMFGMTDIDAVLNSKLASAEIFYQITGSRGIVTFMQCWVIVVYFSEHLPPRDILTSTDHHHSVFNQPMGHRGTDDLGICPRRKASFPSRA